ncbi:sodium/hydrogen exchanger [Wallemia mellicola]|nr:hypothetical protein E3Q24_00905 [Wallemia mellicola]TIB80581.1 sodium/hydrogen exchanger [Wallemia mellicola]TIB86690.1 sodium/hydrogen exchanger [Wallemia mellicola]TIB89615.1 sodium/hydrogen exchanger [Wallemia mellicola]TIC05706.1 sodium/hydrogen exchanger [Wallemia mellicola]
MTGDDKNETPMKIEQMTSLALSILTLLIICSLCLSYYLQQKKIRSVHETVIAVFAGMVVGLIIRLSPGHIIREMVTFSPSLFFNLLLPPIILDSGYRLREAHFFRNIIPILTFALAGTFISAVVIGFVVYIFSFLHISSLKISLVECLILGSTLSATDPVTILAIFNTYKVDPKLYSVIFGESILNDAVSIVLYETLSQFHGADLKMSSFFRGSGIFFLSFSGSMALGVIFALACSLGLKHSKVGSYPGIESCLVSLIAYTSYFFSNGIGMSGIVSLIFCGITLKHYAYHNMSPKTQRTTKSMFHVLAQLSENFIFIYLGITLFTQDTTEFKPIFIVVVCTAVVVGRYMTVFPLSKVINLVYRSKGQRAPELPHSHQMMLFWAGLRGAVGVALAAGITGKNSAALRTTVLIVVVLTVVVFGGTTSRMLEVMGIKMGVEDDEASSDEEDDYPTQFGFRRGSNNYPYFNHQTQALSPHYYDNNDIEEGINLELPRQSDVFISTASSSTSLNKATSPVKRSDSAERRPKSSISPLDDTIEDDNEVLPLANSKVNLQYDEDTDKNQLVFRDGKWFTDLDERYLLPLFSNSVASRRHNARKSSSRRNLQEAEQSQTNNNTSSSSLNEGSREL